MKKFLMCAAHSASAPVRRKRPCSRQTICRVTSRAPPGSRWLGSSLKIAGGDPNDYNIYVGVTGNSSAPAFITAFDFTITGVDGAIGAGGYTAEPTLLQARAACWNWGYVSFDKLDQGSECNNGGAGQAVCTESVGVGTTNAAVAPNTTNVWKLYANLDGAFLISTSTTGRSPRPVCQRATGGDGGQLSPGARLTRPALRLPTACRPQQDVPSRLRWRSWALGCLAQESLVVVANQPTLPLWQLKRRLPSGSRRFCRSDRSHTATFSALGRTRTPNARR